ncbi:MAG: prepilin-type N-terminal cleavage/methylation domain-containing protein [Planctomycetota bacterium]
MTGYPLGRREDGFTLIELLMGVTIFLVAAIVLGNHISTNYATTAAQRDKVFAFTKAQAILAEIHSSLDRGDFGAAIDLDVLDDGIVPKPTLSIARDANGALIAPDHPLSGNLERDGTWLWGRRVSVRPFTGLLNRTVRYVTVRIVKQESDGEVHEIASLSSVVNSVGSAFPTTQVFDVYLLAMENIPGWWVFMEAIVPFVESAVTDLENRNPGLSVRTHWITKVGYGRDPVYRPYINDRQDSNQTINDVYLYPGAMPAGSASTFYYVPDMMNGKVSIDGVDTNGWDAVRNPYPYTLADFNNHCMRYPQAYALWQARKKTIEDRREAIRQAQRLGVPAPPPLDDMSTEPPLQILVEDMAQRPDFYRHSLLINLHGELLPTPPLRNFSDAAKLPRELPYVRVVTHPEELRTQSPPAAASAVTDVYLRVYAYTSEPAKYTAAGYGDVMDVAHPIVLQVMDVDLTDGTGTGVAMAGVTVQSARGGVPIAGDSNYRTFLNAPNFNVNTFTYPEMTWSCFFHDPGPGQRKSTVFVLYNTPVKTPPISSMGLNANLRSRPYGLEYVPGPVGTGGTFTKDLVATGDGPKNTARWRIKVPSTVWDARRFVTTDSPPVYFDPRTTPTPDVTLTIRTRIFSPSVGSSFEDLGASPSGFNGSYNEPYDLSETYTWWARTRDAVPFTERAQIWGDPRHNPYRDLMSGDADFGDGYNWWWDSLTNNSQNAKTDHPGITQANNRWNGAESFDVPRLMYLFRNAIVQSESIYTTLSGYSYYYVGCGNEIGYDSANGYANSIPVNQKPWGGADISTGYINSILTNRYFVRINESTNYWWEKPWLGELFPDAAYATDWFVTDTSGTVRGNLTAGTATTQFKQVPMQTAYSGSTAYKAQGTSLYNCIHRTAEMGCVSFFNNGTTSAHFNHHFSTASGPTIGAGLSISNDYGFPVPSSITTTRPFTVNTSGNNPPEFGLAPYSTSRYAATILRQYVQHNTSYLGSGLVQLANPTDTAAGFIIVNGIANTTETGSSFLAKWCLLSMFQSYFELGDNSLRHRIKQPPRVEITSPTEISEILNPRGIDIQFHVEWLRWDRLAYTRTTPATFAEDEAEIDYVIDYSVDNGANWLHIQDDTPAVIGEKPTDPMYVIPDAGTGPDTYYWPTPSRQFPDGSYVIRIEAYRRDMALHYSTHQMKIYIER